MSMVLLDTSVWVDHLRSGVPLMAELGATRRLLTHPFVVAELACGNLPDRVRTLEMLDALPSARVASTPEVRHAVERHALFGRGVGFVDVSLFASTLVSSPTRLWTRDRRLHALAERAGIAFDEHRRH